MAEHGDSPDDPIPVAIETSHGLLVASLRNGSRRVFAINPLAAARYRDRHGVSRKKSSGVRAGSLGQFQGNEGTCQHVTVLDEPHSRDS